MKHSSIGGDNDMNKGRELSSFVYQHSVRNKAQHAKWMRDSYPAYRDITINEIRDGKNRYYKEVKAMCEKADNFKHWMFTESSDDA